MPENRFATTRWSVVINAGHGSPSDASRALAALCENYWFPLYAFVRRTGHSAEDAKDLTQEFFLQLLANNVLAVADRQRGRFRSFLLGAIKHFLANQRRSRETLKRGGGQTVLSLDFATGEDCYCRIEPVDDWTPERLYEKRWALNLLDIVLRRLHDEHEAAGKAAVFETLKQFLAGDVQTLTYQDVASQLAMSEGAVKVAVHRLRRRYRKLLKEEIAQTIGEGESLEGELAQLLAALSAK